MKTNGVDRDELRRLVAQRVRELAHALVAHESDDSTLERIGTDVARMVEALRPRPRRHRQAAIAELLPLITGPAGQSASSVLLERPVSGPGNPTAAEVVFRRQGDEIVADVRFGPAFEGAPGRVHGGMVAAMFDDVLGGVLSLAKAPAYTARLAVEYKAPVPVDVTVEFRSRLERRDGRKLHAVSEARHAEQLLARAEALFIVVDPEHFQLGRRSPTGSRAGRQGQR